MSSHRQSALPRRVHLLGVGGAGVSALARVLSSRGHALTGHDRARSALLDALLADHPFDVALGASTVEHLPTEAALVIRSAAVGEDDPQVAAARARGIPVLKYAEALGRIAPPERTLAVAGTHGKTTTAWMLYHALVGLRLDAVSAERAARSGGAVPAAPGAILGEPGAVPAAPGAIPAAPGAIIGGLCRSLDTNAVAGEPDGWFAVEACEYDRSFLELSPRGAVVTNVEADHLDYYGTLDAIHVAFARFADRVHEDGLLVLGRDVPDSIESAARCEVWRLGRELDVQLLGETRGCFRFRLRGPGWASPEVELAVPGHFNVENAALALALAAGLAAGESFPRTPPLERAARAVSAYEGAARRFEPWCSGPVEVVHDYAHHPTEVRVTIEAARRAFPERSLHVLFQPHQHSRTARFLHDFVDALRAADRVVVADVYGARVHVDGERAAGAAELVAGCRSIGVDAELGGSGAEACARLVAALPERAAVLVLGAGDIEDERDELQRRLALRGAPGSRAGS